MFKKAVKYQSKLRLALFGPSGSGKTYTALRIATGLGKKIALIDSEKGSASKYADRFEFEVAEPGQPSIDNYVNIIKMANEYDVLIIDSITHPWQELLADVDKIAKTKYKGNSWAAWSEGTPKQRKLIEAILNSHCHIIATMRSKTEWTTVSDDNGKGRPQRVGLAPEQGKGIEYEFDMLIELSTDHVANVIKDRTGKYQDKLIEYPDEDLGKELLEWLNSGEEIKVGKEALDASDHLKQSDSIDALRTTWIAIYKHKWNEKEMKFLEGIKEEMKNLLSLKTNENFDNKKTTKTQKTSDRIITEKQEKRLWYILNKKSNKSSDDLYDYLIDNYNIDDPKQILATEYNNICEWLEAGFDPNQPTDDDIPF